MKVAATTDFLARSANLVEITIRPDLNQALLQGPIAAHSVNMTVTLLVVIGFLILPLLVERTIAPYRGNRIAL